jgi:Protein of unknown function (DUF992)
MALTLGKGISLVAVNGLQRAPNCRRNPSLYHSHRLERSIMKKILTAALFATVAAFTVAPAEAAGIKVGVLSCKVEGGAGFIIGSSKEVDCLFKGTNGRRENYVGTMGKLGIDIGVTTDTRVAWIVFAPGKMKAGSLRGSYQGASAEATVGIGLGANVLIGGFKKSINLQPVSVQAQTGLNIAGGLGSLNLRSVTYK